MCSSYGLIRTIGPAQRSVDSCHDSRLETVPTIFGVDFPEILTAQPTLIVALIPCCQSYKYLIH